MFEAVTDCGYFGVVSAKTNTYHGFFLPDELAGTGQAIMGALAGETSVMTGVTVTQAGDGLDNALVAVLAQVVVNGFNHGAMAIVPLGMALSLALGRRFFWLEDSAVGGSPCVNIYFMDGVSTADDAAEFFYALPCVQAVEITLSVTALMETLATDRLSH